MGWVMGISAMEKCCSVVCTAVFLRDARKASRSLEQNDGPGHLGVEGNAFLC